MNTAVDLIKQLRAETGAGVMDCRKALEQSDQNFAMALDCLRETAALKAMKQTAREAREGKIELYSHGSGRIGVIVEINIETEFASRSQAFHQFAHEIALQITSTAPLYVRDEDIPQHILDEQAQAAAEKARSAGKPEMVVEQIAAGVLEKYKNQHVLLRQAYIREESITVAQLLNQAISQTGENIIIRRFVRWEICPDAQTTRPRLKVPSIFTQ
jgi:elongation factor Ts